MCNILLTQAAMWGDEVKVQIFLEQGQGPNFQDTCMDSVASCGLARPLPNDREAYGENRPNYPR